LTAKELVSTPALRRALVKDPSVGDVMKSWKELKQVPRRVGVAGGASKYRAIRAALRGAWVNVLVTDLDTARALAEDPEAPAEATETQVTLTLPLSK